MVLLQILEIRAVLRVRCPHLVPIFVQLWFVPDVFAALLFSVVVVRPLVSVAGFACALPTGEGSLLEVESEGTEEWARTEVAVVGRDSRDGAEVVRESWEEVEDAEEWVH